MSPPKEYVWQQFERSSEGIYKISRAKCKHCGHELVSQAGRAEKHLSRYSKYASYLIAIEKAAPTID